MIEQIERAAGRPVSRETFQKLEAYTTLLREQSARQNLISASTIDSLWERHILDSAQLLRFVPEADTSWVDIGSGAGLPGVVVAILTGGPVTLVEPRRLRAEFLESVVSRLGLNARVVLGKAERTVGQFDVITGRAVAALSEFLALSAHLSTKNSRWVLPKGRNAQSELADAKRRWQGVFHVEQSVTDADSWIVIATGVRARG
jgi:16S rRNA (guanine527-N7)-methyltransferase